MWLEKLNEWRMREHPVCPCGGTSECFCKVTVCCQPLSIRQSVSRFCCTEQMWKQDRMGLLMIVTLRWSEHSVHEHSGPDPSNPGLPGPQCSEECRWSGWQAADTEEACEACPSWDPVDGSDILLFLVDLHKRVVVDKDSSKCMYGIVWSTSIAVAYISIYKTFDITFSI